MKSDFKKGIMQEILYLLAIVTFTAVLKNVGIIAEEKIWLYICFFIFLPDPIRRNALIDFSLFKWSNWKKYLLHTLVLAIIILVIEQIIY